MTAHAVSHEGLANNHESCKDKRIGHGLEPKIFWVPLNGTRVAERKKEDVVLQTLILMGDWCRQGGHHLTKETTAKGKGLVTSSDILCKKESEPSGPMRGASSGSKGEKTFAAAPMSS